jgi:mannose-6-phosphate isomerase-like protein (cupin superfamily)
MHINIQDKEGKQVSSGVIVRELLSRDQTTPGGLAVHHYVLTSGEVEFGEPNVEYQHYIISGCGRMGGKFVHGETAIFVPGSQRWDTTRKHRIAHAGESELRIITASYKNQRQNFRWAKTRSRNLYQTTPSISNIINQQLFTEEEHAIMGALRMHAIDIQTHPPLSNNPEHKNPEEIMYILRGTGEAISGNSRYNVRPGSLIYAKEGDTHGIYNTSKDMPLQYFVLEFIEQDKSWIERGMLE